MRTKVSLPFALLLLAQFVSSVSNAAPSVVKFSGTEKAVPAKTVLTISAVDLETAEIVEAVRTKPRSKVNIDCASDYCLAVAKGSFVRTVRGRTSVSDFFGSSKWFSSGVTASKTPIIKIIARGKTAARARVSASRLQAGRSAASGGLRVGIPSSGFKLSGTAAQEALPGAASSAVTTILAQSPCYRSGTDFVIVETDPRILKARKKEFDLVKKGFSSPNPNFVDSYQAPNASVRGAVFSKGGMGRASIELVSSNGTVIASSSGSVESGGWLAALDRAALDLGGQLCQGPKVSVTFAKCELERCTCCDHAGAECEGFRILPRLEGTAKLPVGAMLFFNIPADSSGIHSCGGVAATSLGGSARACTRVSESQPESIQWIISAQQPKAPDCSCPRVAAPTALDFIATALDQASGERDDAVLDQIPCSGLED